MNSSLRSFRISGLSSLVLAIAVVPGAHAINITVLYDNTQPGAVNPAFDPTGAQLTAIANYAASFYEDVFEDAGHSLTLTFWYTDLTGQLGDHDFISDDANNRESVGQIQIDTQDSNGVARNYFFDPTPSNNSEFTMTQTLWRNLSAANQIDWYNAGAGVPVTLETSFTGTAPAGSPAVGTIDLLSLVFHEMGHSLGMSSANSLTVAETADGDYDFDSSWIFGGVLAADTLDRPTDFLGHLDDPSNVMNPSVGGAGTRELPSHIDLFAMAASHNYTLLDVPRREFYDSNGDWNTDANWTGDTIPGSLDDTFVRNGATASLSANGNAANLQVLEGALVQTVTHTLFVQNTTTVGGTNSQITVNTAGELDTDTLVINSGGDVVVLSTGLLQAENITIANGGVLRGYGTVDINNAFGELTNDGTIQATNGGELLFTSLNNLALDLGGDIEAINGNIRFETGMSTPMTGDMTVGTGREVIFNDGGTIGSGGLLLLQGTSASPATVSGSVLNVAFNGVIRADGVGVVENTLAVISGAILETAFGDPNSELRLNGFTFFQGGRILGDGIARQNGDALVQQDTEISIDTYDMDGAVGTTVITINPDRTLTISSPNVDTVAANDFDGTFHVNSGTLDIETAWRLDGVLNLSETTTTNAMLRGAGGVTVNNGGAINITGQVEVETAVNVVNGMIFVDGLADFTGPTTLGAAANVEINNANDFLRLAGQTTLAGPSLVGSGLLMFDGNVDVTANTSVGTAETDLDGLFGDSQVLINSALTFSIASISIESTGNDGFDGVITNRGTFSVLAGWRLDGELNMEQIASLPTLSGLGTFRIHTTGTYSTAGGSSINPPLEVAGTMLIAGGVTEANGTNSLEATADVDVAAGAELWFDGPTTFHGGSYTGGGVIRFNAMATIQSNTTIATARVDLDGAVENTHVVINNSDLVLNVDRVDFNNSIFAGTIDVFGSDARLEVNLTNPLAAWRVASGGTLNFSTPSSAPVTMLDGSDLTADGTINADGRVRLGANLFLLGTLDTFDGTTDVHFGGGGQNLVFNTATVDGPGDITIDDPTRMHLQGGANVGVNVENAGRLEVGFVPGEVAFDLTEAGSATIRGDYSQTGTGIFGVEVGGLVPAAEHDVLTITGTARLGGELEVELIDGFLPEIGDEVIVMLAASVINVFDTVTAFDGGDLFGIDISVLYSATDVMVRFDDLFLLGDYNRNGMVEAADYVVWRKTLGQVGMDLAADGNGNDEIDAGDYDVWLAHFGESIAGSGTTGGGAAADGQTGVPEPGGFWLLTTAAIVGLACRRPAMSRL